MTDAHHATTPREHAAHDTTIVATLAARPADIDDDAAAIARAQVAACPTCADLLADLLFLRNVLPTTTTPARPRDFRLSDDDAARLRRSGWRRLLGLLGSPRDSVSRPLAIGFTTLGLAGLLVASVPSMFMASGPSTVLSTVGNAVPQAAPAAGEASGSDRMSIESGASPSGPEDAGVFSGSNRDEVTEVAGDPSTFSLRDDGSGPSVLFVVAGFLLIAGLGLFGLRWSARRLL